MSENSIKEYIKMYGYSPKDKIDFNVVVKICKDICSEVR